MMLQTLDEVDVITDKLHPCWKKRLEEKGLCLPVLV